MLVIGINWKGCLRAYQSFSVCLIFVFVLNAISVAEMGTPFSQQVNCCSWQTEWNRDNFSADHPAG